MFDAIRDNKRIAQVILAILIVPFAVFGLERYFADAPGGVTVAEVGGTPIHQTEFDRALNEEQDRLREALGERATRSLLASEELRQAALDKLVFRRLLALYADDMRLTVSAGQLQQAITRIEVLQENGQFSPALYQALLRQQGMNAATFEAMFALDLRIQQLMGSIAGTTLIAGDSAHRLLAAQIEERVVREMRFPIAPYLAKIRIDDDAIQKYYDGNLARFEQPERIKAEYLVFDDAALQARIEVAAADVQKAYEGKDYVQPEERQVRHILIEVAPDADEAAVAEARGRVDGIAAALRKNPRLFPQLAQEKSQDLGTKDNGGDLGFIVRGQQEAEFDGAAFALKLNEIGGPVRTGYGFHLIQVTGIHPGGEKRPLAEVRDEIVAELRKQAAVQRFAEDADKFSEMVFNQSPDSLKPVAEAFGLEIRHTGWIDRGSESAGEINSENLVADLFADDAVNQHHNTRALEVGPNMLVAARVLEHEAARRVPLEEVRGQIEALLRREEALRQAREKGGAALAGLEKGEAVASDWSEAHTFQRGGGSQAALPPEAARVVFAAPVAKLPAWTGVELPDDAYVIYQIDAVEHPAIKDDDPRMGDLKRHYERLLAQHDFDAFLAVLRTRYKVETKLPPRQVE
ncbi:MAG: SurA N-terminal domain-containing protein [Azoarcus sp.]|jgi:peptidyl-prolyl cis-trans isomerase D|nr:SurA N-terminal domain-containing protein [Azoarcus sp.]